MRPFLRRLAGCLAAGPALLLAPATAAQVGTPAAPPPADVLTLKVMPLALADPWTPTFRVGAEYRPNAAWGLEASYGHQLRNLGWGAGRGEPLNNRYHKIHVEARRYVGTSPFYLAVAGFRVQQQFDRGAGTLFQHDQLYTFTSAHVRRVVTGGVLKAGVVLPLDAHWRLDLAAGAGWRSGDIRYQTRELSPADPMYGGLDYGPECGFSTDFSPTTAPGTFRRVTLAFDVKLGYALGH